jgi:hypothetical protein
VRILKGAKKRPWITRMLHRSANAGKRQTRPPIAAHVTVHFTVTETRPEYGKRNRQRYACCTHGVSLIVSIGCFQKKAIAIYLPIQQPNAFLCTRELIADRARLSVSGILRLRRLVLFRS